MSTSVLRRPIRVLTALTGGLSLVLAPGAAASATSSPGSLSPASITSYSADLNGLSALSRSDAWAVGEASAKALVLHWNGAVWTRVASPNPRGSDDTRLLGVSAVSRTDAWAVGHYFTSSGAEKTLVLRWNGRRWMEVVAPNPGSFPALSAVSAVSRVDAWAVGQYFPSGQAASRALVLRWNGRRWTQAATPGPPVASLNGVSGRTADDAWAVGSYAPGGVTSKTLALYWNGSRWARVATPNPGGPQGSLLTAASALSSSDAWIVGYYFTPRTFKTLILHWNGTHLIRS